MNNYIAASYILSPVIAPAEQTTTEMCSEYWF